MIKDIKKVEVYITSDNKYFNTKEEAEEHEIEIVRTLFIDQFAIKYFRNVDSLEDVIDIFYEKIKDIYYDLNEYFTTSK